MCGSFIQCVGALCNVCVGVLYNVWGALYIASKFYLMCGEVSYNVWVRCVMWWEF